PPRGMSDCCEFFPSLFFPSLPFPSLPFPSLPASSAVRSSLFFLLCVLCVLCGDFFFFFSVSSAVRSLLVVLCGAPVDDGDLTERGGPVRDRSHGGADVDRRSSSRIQDSARSRPDTTPEVTLMPQRLFSRPRLRLAIVLIIAALAPRSSSFAGDDIRVLLLSGRNNHDWRSTTPALAECLEEGGRFRVTVLDDTAAMTRALLAEHDVVVSNFNSFVRRGAPEADA